jgi:hypothetical protein
MSWYAEADAISSASEKNGAQLTPNDVTAQQKLERRAICSLAGLAIIHLWSKRRTYRVVTV